MNCYEILSLPRDASLKQIRESFITYSYGLVADIINFNNEAIEALELYMNAYKRLSNPVLRYKCDCDLDNKEFVFGSREILSYTNEYNLADREEIVDGFNYFYLLFLVDNINIIILDKYKLIASGMRFNIKVLADLKKELGEIVFLFENSKLKR